MKAWTIDEALNFEKRKDPFGALGIGKRQLIKDWLDEMSVKNYKINDDLSIDLYQNPYLDHTFLNIFPDYIQFNNVFASFFCGENELVSLRGCPLYVKGNFSCSHNYLKTLEFCPKKVDGVFWCNDNASKFTKEYVRGLCKVKTDFILV